MTTPTIVTAAVPNPCRGEVWLLDLTGGGGAEIDKVRPAVVVSSDAIKGGLPLKIVVPLTSWSDGFKTKLWHRQILPTAANGLGNTSSADALQVRSVTRLRFKQKLGVLRATELQEIVAAVAIVLEYK